MAKYPKHVTELANGGLFKRVVGRLFHYTDAQAAKLSRHIDEVSPADLARHNKIKNKRRAYVGSTPGKSSATGRQVLERMSNEKPPRVRHYDPSRPRDLQDVEVKGPDGKWYPLEECDMGHVPVDAVSYWNNVGRFHGPKSPEVRDWMRDPDNYEIQPSKFNQADGSIMGDSGFRYQPPATLPKGLDISDVEAEVLKELATDWKGQPIP